jgi:hypothetical protein
MKKHFFLFQYIFCFAILSFSQGVEPAPEGKSVVYFVRPSGTGFAINFSYFDSDKLIGIFPGKGYIRYECDPGSHLFWARSENKDFVEAQLEAGKVYFIEAVVQMGFIKAQVGLQPIDPKNQKKMKPLLNLINKKSPEKMTEDETKIESENFKEIISRGLIKYKEDKEGGETFKVLKKSMFYETN